MHNVMGRLTELVNRTSATVSVCARRLSTGEELAYGPNQVLPTASAIKLPILVALFASADAATISLDEQVEILQSDRAAGTGVLKELPATAFISIREAATLMIVLSDNTATNVVLRLLGGPDAVNSSMDALGLSTVRLHNRVDFDLIGDNIRRFGEATPADLCTIAERIANRTIASEASCTAMEDILEKQQFRDQVGRYLQVSPYWRETRAPQPPLRLASKTGIFAGTWTDVGIVRFQNDGFAYAAMYDGGSDRSLAVESQGAVINGLIGRLLVEHWWSGAAPAPLLDTAYLHGLTPSASS